MSNFATMKFSVIIATYNRADYLKECLQCLVQQTIQDFEVIIADDGSTDNTADVVKGFDTQLRITYLKNPNAGYPGKPRNIAVQHATTEWLCFLDSDDVWTDDKLELCLPYLDKTDVIYHNLKYIGNSKPFYRRALSARQVQTPVFNDLMTYGNSIPLSASMIRKDIFLQVGGFFQENSSIGGLDDYDLWLKVARISDRFQYIPKNLGMYRIHNTNMTEVSSSQIKKLNIIYDKYAPFLPTKDVPQALIIKSYYTGIIHERMKDYPTAITLYKQCLPTKIGKLRLKAFTRILLSTTKRILKPA